MQNKSVESINDTSHVKSMIERFSIKKNKSDEQDHSPVLSKID